MVTTDQHYLHITNGDSTASLLKQSDVPGDVLPWRDVLHDGPVPGGLSLAALSDIRATYLAGDEGVFAVANIKRDFTLRDVHLQGSDRYVEIVLWFEHDLYDQLQLLQLLDWFVSHPPQHATLSLICINSYPGVEPFYGLGQLSSQQLTTLFGTQQPIKPRQLALGQQGWQAFTSADPNALVGYLELDLSPLPFMHAAVVRFLQDYPSVQNGLARTEQQILQRVADGITKPGRLFADHQQLEEAPYLGDSGFWQRIANLCNSATPLLSCEPSTVFQFPMAAQVDETFRSQRLGLTKIGQAVLSDQADWLQHNPIDRWYGGVHMQTGGQIWRWDRESKTIVNLFD